MLEDVLQPQRLFWLVHVETVGADPEDLLKIADHIAECFSTEVARSAPYLRELTKVYAALWLRLHPTLRTTERYTFGDTAFFGKSSPCLDDHAMAKVCTELAHGADPRFDASRLVVYQSVLQHQRRLRRVPVPAGELGALKGCLSHKRLRVIMTKYAPECTFKTRGDFNVHGELILDNMPAWLCCAMVQNEMPYPLMCKAYPERVNRVVRPLLERPITDSVEMINWEDDVGFCVRDFVTIMCLVIEVLASSSIMLLINGDIIRHKSKTFPLPFVWRDPDGVIIHGVRLNNTLHVLPPETSAVTTCLWWLTMCKHEKVEVAENLYNIVLSELSEVEERNPLRKFLI